MSDECAFDEALPSAHTADDRFPLKARSGEIDAQGCNRLGEPPLPTWGEGWGEGVTDVD
jgi:hypothetical protein